MSEFIEFLDETVCSTGCLKFQPDTRAKPLAFEATNTPERSYNVFVIFFSLLVVGSDLRGEQRVWSFASHDSKGALQMEGPVLGLCHLYSLVL